jgi:hypothetical protein
MTTLTQRIPASECVVERIKYKSDPESAAA